MQQKNIGTLKAYGAFWKYYGDFSRRTTKEAFWKAFFIQSLIILALTSPMYYMYESIIERNDLMAGVWLIPLGIYSIATVIPTIAIIVRRLHDIDRHGCWFFLYLIPFVGVVFFFIMLSKPSAPFDVYPGRSGSGPYTGPEARPQYTSVPQYAPPQYAPPPNPFSQTYIPPQYPYAPPPVYYRPLPPPRRFAPPSGGNKAIAAIILSIVVAVASNAYSLICNDYMQRNIDRYISTLLGNAFGNLYGDFNSDPFGWNDDPGGFNNPWGGAPQEGDDDWQAPPGYDWNSDDQKTEDELMAIDYVREGVIEGFPEFTIEEVLMTRVEEGSLDWDCFREEGGEYPAYYVYASGYAVGDFVIVYAGFEVFDDGTIEIFNLDDGERDEYYEGALEMYKEWYELMLSGIDTSVA